MWLLLWVSFMSRAHSVFRHPRGDHITYLMVYASWEERGFSGDWWVRRQPPLVMATCLTKQLLPLTCT